VASVWFICGSKVLGLWLFSVFFLPSLGTESKKILRKEGRKLRKKKRRYILGGDLVSEKE
jgi:hypothetical protein